MTPSPLKSALTIPLGLLPAGCGRTLNATLEDGWVMTKGTGFDAPPPGAGVDTVMMAVPAVFTSTLLTLAANWLLCFRAVDRGCPFQLTTEEARKPVP